MRAIDDQKMSDGRYLMKDGRILMTGGTKDGTNYNPVANSIYVKSE